jgi:hypothetical protein
MNSLSRKEISFINETYLKEKNTIIYDEESKRVIEKIISTVHPDDETKDLEESKILYTYDKDSNIDSIIEIRKDYKVFIPYGSRKGKIIFYGEDASVFSRSLKKTNLRQYTDVQYIRLNHIPYTSKPFIIILLRLETFTTADSMKKIVRVYSKLQYGQYYEYKYSKSNPEELLMINKYNIIANLSFLSDLLNFLGIFLVVSPFFIKSKVDSITTDLPNGVEIANEEKHNDVYRISDYSNGPKKIVVHETVNKEDIFILEKETIMKQINKYENKQEIG